MGLGYGERIQEVSQGKRSNIILALDLPVGEESPKDFVDKCSKLVGKVSRHICAVKTNRQTAVFLSSTRLSTLVNRMHEMELPTIMDCKLNDVGHTNVVIAEQYFDVGFDAITASPFVGWKEGLEPVFSLSESMGRGILLLAFMSHTASREGYGQTVVDAKTRKLVPQYEVFARWALRWGADGVIVGATYPPIISEIHGILRDRVPIYSPGIGPQGGAIGKAMRAGSKYLIVGRSILQSSDPAEAARIICRRAREPLESF